MDGLWKEHLNQGSASARSELIGAYDELVRTIAATMFAKRHGMDVEFAEYYQLGIVGLIEAVDRYSPIKGAAFETFATYRIRGSILNGLEKLTERNSQIAYQKRRSKARIKSITEGSDSHKRSAFEEMVELTLGLAIGFVLEDSGLVDDKTKQFEDVAYQASYIRDLRRMLDSRVIALPDREKKIIQYHYYQGVKFEEIANMLGITKGRVSQIHKRALQRMRLELAGNSPNLNTYL